MHVFVFFCAMTIVAGGALASDSAAPSSSAEAVVQVQLDAYNAKDMDKFLATYHANIQVFDHPNTLTLEGLDAIRQRYTERFAEPNLHAIIKKRTVMGNFVIDHERVARTFPEGPGVSEVIAIYEVIDGKIAKVWFIRGLREIGASLEQK